MSKILITGATGYLAKTLVPYAAQRADVIGVARNSTSDAYLNLSSLVKAMSVDLADSDALTDLVMSEQPDAIIHCAACNPGDGNEQQMLAVNEVGTLHIARAAHKLSCRVVSVSSDTVLSGNEAPYADDAPTSAQPKNAYAVSKARAEAALFSVLPDAVAVRTSLIYGTDYMDRSTQGFNQRLSAGESLNLFTDVMRQPMHDKALAAGLFSLATEHVGESGTINIAGQEILTRFDFGVCMLDYWGIDYKNKLEAVSGKGIAGMPMDLSLTLGRATSLGLPTPGVSAVLEMA